MHGNCHGAPVSRLQRRFSDTLHIYRATAPSLPPPGYVCALLLTFGSRLRYSAPMPIQFILPKKFTRDHIEWRVDELALQFQGTKDKKIIAQIAALSRLLAKMDARFADSSRPKNRQ